MAIRKGQHITIEQAIKIFDTCPNAVLTRSEGGFFDQATRKATQHITTSDYMTFRTAQGLANRGIIELRNSSATAGLWVKAK